MSPHHHKAAVRRFQLVNLTDFDPPPSAKKARLSLQQPSSSGSSATGRLPGTLWPFFTRSTAKQNKSHYSAFCNACTLAGANVKVLGVSDSMKSHLQKCPHVSEAVHAWAKDWTKDSEPFVSEDAEDSGAMTPHQSALQRFMPLKDVAMSVIQQEEFHMLLLQGTVSGNLPFSWIDNEYIQAAFAIARPTAVLPSRRALSEKLLKKAVLVMSEKVEAGLATSKQGVTLSFDAWTDESHNQLLALAVTTSLPQRQT